MGGRAASHVLGIRGLRAAESRIRRHAALGGKVSQHLVGAGQMMRHVSLLLIRNLVGDLCRTAGTPGVRFSVQIQTPILSANEWLTEINGIVDDDRVQQMVAVPDEMLASSWLDRSWERRCA